MIYRILSLQESIVFVKKIDLFSMDLYVIEGSEDDFMIFRKCLCVNLSLCESVVTYLVGRSISRTIARNFTEL